MVYACHPGMVMQGVQPACIPYSEQDLNLPSPANENLRLKSPWMTAAEAWQTIQRIKARLRRENARNHVLLTSAKRRRIWEEALICEQCLRWQYFR